MPTYGCRLQRHWNAALEAKVKAWTFEAKAWSPELYHCLLSYYIQYAKYAVSVDGGWIIGRVKSHSTRSVRIRQIPAISDNLLITTEVECQYCSYQENSRNWDWVTWRPASRHAERDMTQIRWHCPADLPDLRAPASVTSSLSDAPAGQLDECVIWRSRTTGLTRRPTTAPSQTRTSLVDCIMFSVDGRQDKKTWIFNSNVRACATVHSVWSCVIYSGSTDVCDGSVDRTRA